MHILFITACKAQQREEWQVLQEEGQIVDTKFNRRCHYPE